jgi:hypothetical protein
LDYLLTFSEDNHIVEVNKMVLNYIDDIHPTT